MNISIKVKKSGEQTREWNTTSPTTVGAVLQGLGISVGSGQTLQINGRTVNANETISADCEIWILKQSSNA